VARESVSHLLPALQQLAARQYVARRKERPRRFSVRRVAPLLEHSTHACTSAINFFNSSSATTLPSNRCTSRWACLAKRGSWVTRQRRTEAKGKVWIATVEPPETDHFCRGCGKTITNESTHCAGCAVEAATTRLIGAASLGRVAARSPEARAKHGATRRRQAKACSEWDASTQPAWLTSKVFSSQIQPLLRSIRTSAIRSRIGVSRWYAGRIRHGYLPHPRHWLTLAKWLAWNTNTSESWFPRWNFRENPQSISKFRYPNTASNIIPIKITPTIPNIQKPSRIVNCPTVFLLPLDGQWLCMGIVGQRFEVRPGAFMPRRWPTAPGHLLECRHLYRQLLGGVLEMESQLRREGTRGDVVRPAER
jgi:hypothetical protein